MNKHWIADGDAYFFADIPTVTKALPVGVYELNLGMTGFFLNKMADKFELPAKIYGTEKTLIERTIKSFNKFNKNFGILLKGLKGTGKTITAKQICNELKLPVILVNTYYSNIGTFINSINQDVIIFFDEFEKVYEFTSYDSDDNDDGDSTSSQSGGKSKKSISSLLTLMDGVFTSQYKRLFLLTTNKEYMPDAIMSRPSRVRYVKDFSDLPYESIMEILNDIVKNKSLISDIVKLLGSLEIITIDIVKAIAEEATMYNTADPELFTIFNLKKNSDQYDIYDGTTLAEERMRVHSWYHGQFIYIADEQYYFNKIDPDKSIIYMFLKNENGHMDKKTNKQFTYRKAVHKNVELAF